MNGEPVCAACSVDDVNLDPARTSLSSTASWNAISGPPAACRRWSGCGPWRARQRPQSPFTVGERAKWLQDDRPSSRRRQDHRLLAALQALQAVELLDRRRRRGQAILKRFQRVVVIHGHTHQLLTNRIGNIHFHGVLSTAALAFRPGGNAMTIQMARGRPTRSIRTTAAATARSTSIPTDWSTRSTALWNGTR